MFTGIIAGIGTVTELARSADGVALTISAPLARELGEGDSIAVSGVCLTATDLSSDSFAAAVMNQTLAHTSLASATTGTQVNLELPLRASDRLGGHMVQGHVDAMGTVRRVTPDGFARLIEIDMPPDVLRYLVPRGSIAVDGVSLTVAAVHEASVTVSLIPETLERTSLGLARPGSPVNLEVDVLAKYVEKALRNREVHA